MPSAAVALPLPFREGDRLDSKEFLRRWDALPELKHAELIDGVVFMASPVSLPHGTVHLDLNAWAGQYRSRTPGCQAGSDCTWLMGSRDVPQPDIFLRILPEWGGQSQESGRYGSGAPELIVEVSGSSRSRDLGIKLDSYQRAGVCEYLTVQLYPREVAWRHLVRGCYREMKPGRDGILRSRVVPGLWLDPDALWEGRLLEAAGQGLASAEHEAFLRKLNESHRPE